MSDAENNLADRVTEIGLELASMRGALAGIEDRLVRLKSDLESCRQPRVVHVKHSDD